MSGLPPAGQWQPDPLSIGSEVDLHGYRFRVTLHGPNVERACADCGGICYAVPEYPDPRCGDHWTARTGAAAGLDRLALAEHPPRRL